MAPAGVLRIGAFGWRGGRRRRYGRRSAHRLPANRRTSAAGRGRVPKTSADQTMQTFHVEELETPTGRMLVMTDSAGRLAAADWQDHEHRLIELVHRYYGARRVELVPRPGQTAPAQALAAAG